MEMKRGQCGWNIEEGPGYNVKLERLRLLDYAEPTRPYKGGWSLS